MANNKVKVVGYAKKEVYNGNIEYRNFSPDLVGNQTTNGNSTFTFGNFAITTTIENKPSKIFTTNKFSNFVSLADLDLSVEETALLLDNNANLRLNLDKSNVCGYAYFGSMLDYVRVALEDVITKWPASLYMSPILGIYNNMLTIEDYSYETLIDESTFKINTNIIKNPYQLNYLQNGTILGTFNETNDLRNMAINYGAYSVLRGSDEYKVLNFTGATQLADDYIYFRVKGNPFSDITGTSSTIAYHIKPNKTKVDQFFNELPDFERYLLNRLTSPSYTSTFRFRKVSDSGHMYYDTKTLTWPVTDGYNIDFESTQYTEYVSKLIQIATECDSEKSDLMTRFLTSESISDFDTRPNCDGIYEETAGQKMNRTLKIWGREFDELKRYIDGIQFANTVTYNHMDNTPDMVLKYLARTLGWEMVQSVLENDLLKNYIHTPESTYSGMSVGYTPIQAEIEMWRRLILNSPWIWKSKGARKAIEFLFKFIGAPDGLIEFNEFIYLAKAPIDVDMFLNLLEIHGLNTDLSEYPIDSDGYPRVLNNTPDMYFQKGGLWYRQTAGSGATIDILTGNNPHIGPYDGGAAFINQFNNLIPNFSATTMTSTTVTTTTTQMFTNYDNGLFNEYDGQHYIDIVSNEDVSLDDCVVVTAQQIVDPHPSPSEVTQCGCEVEGDDFALLINVGCDFSAEQQLTSCEDKLVTVKLDNDDSYIFFYHLYDEFGNEMAGNWSSEFNSQECCRAIGGTPIYKEIWDDSNPSQLINAGYICCTSPKCGCSVTCDWGLATTNISDMLLINNIRYLVFEKPDGSTTSIIPTGCSCVAGLTTPTYITDPNTGESGFACRLNDGAYQDLQDGIGYVVVYDSNTNSYSVEPYNGQSGTQYISFIVAVYEARMNGLLNCDQYMDGGLPQDTGVPIGDTPINPINNNTIIKK